MRCRKDETNYVNVGEGKHRNWIDCRKYGFLTAGQHRKYSDPIRSLVQGDIVAAYLKGFGYVGIGRVKKQAVRVNDFKIGGKLLNTLELNALGYYNNCDNENSEFPVQIEWIKSVDRKNAKWKSKNGLFSSQLIKASLQGQPKTMEFLEQEFNISFNEIMLAE